jgi:hypothetical protein
MDVSLFLSVSAYLLGNPLPTNDFSVIGNILIGSGLGSSRQLPHRLGLARARCGRASSGFPVDLSRSPRADLGEHFSQEGVIRPRELGVSPVGNLSNAVLTCEDYGASSEESAVNDRLQILLTSRRAMLPVMLYGGRPSRRTKSLKRASERRLSRRGSAFT